MESNPPGNTIHPSSRDLTADAALQIAMWVWFSLLALPFVLFLAVIWHTMDSESGSGNRSLAMIWFVGVLIYMGIGVPAAFFWRSRVFKGYMTGQIVAPRDYLIGMCTVWLSLEIAGVLALVGCLVSSTVLPNLMPGLVAFLFFLPLWPSGHSMIRPLVSEHDPAHYAEPR